MRNITQTQYFYSMLPLSVIIMARNEAHRIIACIEALKPLEAEIIVAINNCTDQTATLAKAAGARVVEIPWEGYAATKNNANQYGHYNWLLSIDADEVATPELCNGIISLFKQTMPPTQVWAIKRRLVIGEQVLKHGAVSNEYRVRLFNREYARWNTQAVHEDILFAAQTTPKRLPGWVWHRSFTGFSEHREKLHHYARLFAQQYAAKKTAVSPFKQASAYWGFVKNYVFRGGFLDGNAGLKFAKNEMEYTKEKYRLAKQLIASNASESDT